MGKLTAYLEAKGQRQARPLPLDVVLAEARRGNVGVGDVVRHVDYPEFRARVVKADNGRCLVTVLAGWRGRAPTWPVGVPSGKLEVVG